MIKNNIKGGNNMMKRKKSVLGKKIIGDIAKKMAERDANTTCAFFAYQPRLPLAVKKMRKS